MAWRCSMTCMPLRMIAALVASVAAASPVLGQESGWAYAWGRNDEGQCNVLPPGVNFVATAGGLYHCLALTAECRIWGWGENRYDDGIGSYYVGQATPPKDKGFLAMAAGGYHSVGLKANGSVVCWGSNYQGQCTVPPPNTGFVAISAGLYFTLGLK